MRSEVQPISSNPDIDIEYSSAIKEKLVEKRELRKLWQTNSYRKEIKSSYQGT
jgi:hypothetical protein